MLRPEEREDAGVTGRIFKARRGGGREGGRATNRGLKGARGQEGQRLPPALRRAMRTAGASGVIGVSAAGVPSAAERGRFMM